MRKLSIALALLCAVAATGVHGAPDADPAYRTYPEKIHKYGYTRSKLVLPYRRPWTYGGPTSPYTPGLYDSDTFARRHYGGLRSFRSRSRGLGVHRDIVRPAVRPTPVVKSYVKAEPVVHIEPAPAPAPVITKSYGRPAPPPLPALPRRPLPTVRNIEVPVAPGRTVQIGHELVGPAPAPAPVAVHETYVEPAPAPAPVAVHKTYVEPEPAYAVAEPAPLPAPAPAVPYYDAPAAAAVAAVPYYEEPAAAVVEVAAPAGRVVDSHSDRINLHGNREITHARTVAAIDHTAHHSDTVETGLGFIGNRRVDHHDHGLHQVTAIEESAHDLHRDREYHKVTHEEVHPNLNGGPPLRKRITHGYKRPAPHVQTLYNRRIEVPVARSHPVHPAVAGHTIHHGHHN